MEICIPSKKVAEEFHIIYELKGAQRGADVLSISLSPSIEVTPLEESSIYLENIYHFSQRMLNAEEITSKRAGKSAKSID